MIGVDYIVKVLPNQLVLIINKSTNEREVMTPQEVGKYFQEQFQNELNVWEDKDLKRMNIQSELHKGIK